MSVPEGITFQAAIWVLQNVLLTEVRRENLLAARGKRSY